MDLRERVARAICRASGDNWDDLVESGIGLTAEYSPARDDYRQMADAAIAEVRRHFAADLARAFNGDQEALARVVFGLDAAGAETTPEAPPAASGVRGGTSDTPEAAKGVTGERGGAGAQADASRYAFKKFLSHLRAAWRAAA